jgi:hypothetical protein
MSAFYRAVPDKHSTPLCGSVECRRSKMLQLFSSWEREKIIQELPMVMSFRHLEIRHNIIQITQKNANGWFLFSTHYTIDKMVQGEDITIADIIMDV